MKLIYKYFTTKIIAIIGIYLTASFAPYFVKNFHKIFLDRPFFIIIQLNFCGSGRCWLVAGACEFIGSVKYDGKNSDNEPKEK